jgi:hypothetical protein
MQLGQEDGESRLYRSSLSIIAPNTGGVGRARRAPDRRRPGVRHSLTLLLQMHGLSVLAAADGERGLEQDVGRALASKHLPKIARAEVLRHGASGQRHQKEICHVHTPSSLRFRLQFRLDGTGYRLRT